MKKILIFLIPILIISLLALILSKVLTIADKATEYTYRADELEYLEDQNKALEAILEVLLEEKTYDQVKSKIVKIKDDFEVLETEDQIFIDKTVINFENKKFDSLNE